MISLQKNTPTLRETFSLCHAHGNQRALNDYQLALSATNEINGMEYRCHAGTYYIVPLFIEGQDRTSILRQIAETHEEFLLSAVPTTRASKLFNVRNYWSTDHFLELYELEKLSSARQIIEGAWVVAESLLKHSPSNMTMVCGPISSIVDDVSKEDNLRTFHLTMLKLADEGRNVFNQLPFEAAFRKAEDLLNTTDKHELNGDTTSEFFIEHFYKKIIMTKKNWDPRFIHGSKASTGASLEHDLFLMNGFSPVHLPKGYHHRAA